jgi:hypothetical protein
VNLNMLQSRASKPMLGQLAQHIHATWQAVNTQKALLAERPHILVATPARLQQHLAEVLSSLYFSSLPDLPFHLAAFVKKKMPTPVLLFRTGRRATARERGDGGVR